MNIFGQKIPTYVYAKTNMIRLIVFTALFALVFINIYKPRSSFYWYNVSEFNYLIYSSLVILTGVLVVVISRMAMYYWGRKHEIGLQVYVLWVLLEIFFMALFFTIYTAYLNPERDYLGIFRESLINTSLVLLLPYSVLHLYFAYKDKEKKLSQIEEERLVTAGKQNIYSFYDEKGALRLSVTKENLLYIESADNYVEIWYLNKEAPTKLVVRNSLKNVEKNLANTNVIRSHRSYIVNLEAVKVIRRQKDGIYMEFGIDRVPDIPVSERYNKKITHWFTTCPA
ncbi:MAG: LytTR family transcriptional regulator DNA-binding domain-containing protein [Prevotellaceae bacterium]|nr:LytTR family transcriptional regulator DNA-binding domain-containing protein [Prevotellaceae bacterium]